MWQMNWGFRDLLPTGVRTVKRLAEYLQATWPYFDRKGGADHIWVFGHDQGAWRVRRPRGQRGPDMRWHGDKRGPSSLHLKKSPRSGPARSCLGLRPTRHPATTWVAQSPVLTAEHCP